jgi:hypothetical protein
MPRANVLEEFHLTVLVPPGLREREYTAIRPTLNAARFRARLRHAARQVFATYRSLNRVTVRLSR